MVTGCFRNALALVGLVVVLVALNLSVRATSAFNFSSSEQRGVMWSFDCDWKGNDIDRATSMGDTCGKQCLDRADCTHWTWTAENGGSCWLKGAINATELVAANGTSCGYRVTDSATGNPKPLIRSPSNARAGWPEVMKRVMAVYMKVLARARQIRENAKFRGFASNVANYSPLFASDDGCPASEKCPLAQNPSTGEMNYDWNPCIDENRFTARLNAFLGAAGLPTRWIVDTIRPGVAGIRTRWGSWCNVKNAGIGERPQAYPADAPQVDAVEISEPIPVDRECDPLDPLGLDALADAPRAGQWFQEQFTMLVRNANPPMPAGTVDPPTPADPCMTDPQTNPACDPFWENLAVEYSPQYKFHPDEDIWPITIDEYLTHVTASKGFITEDGTDYQVDYQTGPITPDNLDTLLENPNLKSEHGSTVLFSPDQFHQETPWVTDSARNPENGGTKLYTVIYNPKPDDKDSFVEIQYWLFYPYNYVNPLAGDDNHITDLVAIAIRFSKTGQPQRIWYAQHGDGPVWAWDEGGDWDDPKPSEFATVMGTHPIVYVSEGNHEHYPGAGE
ncbi:unnamed protein product [Closterium sp. Naga37s-1]|nr:unnamed protein product [Closterium sp. Naga37s-1]